MGAVLKLSAPDVEIATTRAAAFLAEWKRTTERLKLDEAIQRMAEVVFAYWAARMAHPKAILDQKRERKIVARLKENRGDLGELLYVVDGARKDDWLMGRDPRAPRTYDGIETIFRDREQVERLANLTSGYRAGKPHPMLEADRAPAL